MEAVMEAQYVHTGQSSMIRVRYVMTKNDPNNKSLRRTGVPGSLIKNPRRECPL